ncbi:MAG: succinate dehydrogenase cytochrome b subunit [Planctomycetota bacterium]
MLRWIASALDSSVGKKILMGLTGILLVLFLLEHLAGNLFLYVPGGEEAFGPFDAYVDFFPRFGPLLPVAEVALGLLFAVHALYAIRITLANREARPTKYVVRNDRGAKTIGSASMILTGLALLAFLVVHLLDFRFDAGFHGDHGRTVAAKLARPGRALFYLAIMAVLGVHLSHGAQSALQSLGIHHPRWTRFLRGLGIAVAVFFAVGFASFPIYYLFFWTAGGAH